LFLAFNGGPADKYAVGFAWDEKHFAGIVVGGFGSGRDNFFRAGIIINQFDLRNHGQNGVGTGSRPISIADHNGIIAGLIRMEVGQNERAIRRAGNVFVVKSPLIAERPGTKSGDKEAGGAAFNCHLRYWLGRNGRSHLAE